MSPSIEEMAFLAALVFVSWGSGYTAGTMFPAHLGKVLLMMGLCGIGYVAVATWVDSDE